MSTVQVLISLYAKIKCPQSFENGGMQATSVDDTERSVGAVKEKREEDASRKI